MFAKSEDERKNGSEKMFAVESGLLFGGENTEAKSA